MRLHDREKDGRADKRTALKCCVQLYTITTMNANTASKKYTDEYSAECKRDDREREKGNALRESVFSVESL